MSVLIAAIERLIGVGARVASWSLLFAVLAAPLTPAQAQELSGVWVMQGCWGDNCNVFTETYELHPDGTFHTWGYSDAGTWSVANGAFSLVITTSNNTTYSGTVRGGVIAGTMQDKGGGQGTFSMQQAGGVVLEQARSLLGNWSGAAIWNSGNAPFHMVFNADGTFHADNGNNGQWGNGNWQMNGSHITIRYAGADNSVFVGTVQGDVISGATSDSHGHSGTFTMTRNAD